MRDEATKHPTLRLRELGLCDCTRCAYHNSEFRGRPLAQGEYEYLAYPEGVPTPPPPPDYGPEVAAAEEAIDTAMQAYAEADALYGEVWKELHSLSTRVLSDREVKALREREGAARAMRDEVGDRLTKARVEHARLLRKWENDQKVAANEARLAEVEAAEQVKTKRHWREVLADRLPAFSLLLKD